MIKLSLDNCSYRSKQHCLAWMCKHCRRNQTMSKQNKKSDAVWHYVSNPILPNEHIPAERRIVLVWLREHTLPFCGYIRYASGSKDSPFFVVYHGNPEKGSDVVAWCDCLPDNGPSIDTAKMYNKEQLEGRGYPERIPNPASSG